MLLSYPILIQFLILSYLYLIMHTKQTLIVPVSLTQLTETLHKQKEYNKLLV